MDLYRVKPSYTLLLLAHKYGPIKGFSLAVATSFAIAKINETVGSIGEIVTENIGAIRDMRSEWINSDQDVLECVAAATAAGEEEAFRQDVTAKLDDFDFESSDAYTYLSAVAASSANLGQAASNQIEHPTSTEEQHDQNSSKLLHYSSLAGSGIPELVPVTTSQLTEPDHQRLTELHNPARHKDDINSRLAHPIPTAVKPPSALREALIKSEFEMAKEDVSREYSQKKKKKKRKKEELEDDEEDEDHERGEAIEEDAEEDDDVVAESRKVVKESPKDTGKKQQEHKHKVEFNVDQFCNF